ncbi:MAG: MBL fold metallo-hydrolase [Chloroflexi bacterium]|nr:MBL fold metallo-hydrolase [Chloroflexota bacterium]
MPVPEILLLNDGTVWQDPGGPFGLVPRTLWEGELPPEAHGATPMTLHALLVRSQGTTVLVETGLGTKLDQAALAAWGLERPEGTLLDQLARQGVSPEDIDVVINTHLHADHCGGNTRIENGQVVPTFARAKYLVQRLEWASAAQPDERTRNTYLPANFQPLIQSGQMRLVHGDTQVTTGLRTVVTRGHTRGHQSVLVEGPRPILFTGDMASLAVHFERLNWLTAFDAEPLETLASKQRWQAWVEDNQAIIICAHDHYRPVGSLTRSGKRLELVPIPLPQSP